MKSFHEWLASVKNSKKELATLLQELENLNLELLEEREQNDKVEYFEKCVEQLVQSCFPSLSKAQEIKIHLWQGNSYETLGAWDKALSAYQHVITLSAPGELACYKAEAHLWVGHIKLMQSQLRAALHAYQKSLKIAQDCKDEKATANAYHGLAYYYFEQGQGKRAASYWEKALEIAERIQEKELIAKVTTNLGVIADMQGNWEKALAYYGQGLSQVEKIGDSRGLAETYHNMGITYASAARWAEAGANYEKGSEIARAVGDVRLQANIRLTRVELYLAIGDSYLAEAMCGQALRTFLHLEDHLGEADCYKFSGVIHGARREWSTAKSFFEKSIQLTRKFKSPLCRAEAHFEYGKMWKQKGNKKSTQKQLEQALSLFEQIKAKKDIEKVKREIAEV